MRRSLAALALAASWACAAPSATLTDAHRAAIADSARTIVDSLLAGANRGDVSAAFAAYSPSPDARYVENGMTYGSLDSVKVTYARMLAGLDSMALTANGFHADVLDADAVVTTVPFHFRMKPKGKAMVEGTGVWTGVLARGEGGWMIVSSHESWNDPGPKATAAMSAMPRP